MKLVQRRFPASSQTLEVGEDGLIQVTLKGLGFEHRHEVPLHVLSPHPQRIQRRPIGYLAAAISVAAVCVITMTSWSWPGADSESRGGGSIFLALSLLMFTWLLGMYRRRAVNVLVFYNRYDGRATLMPWFENPDRQSFEAFIKALTQRIERSGSPTGTPTPASMEQELRSLKKMMDEGLISAEEFEELKRRTLGLKERAPIGFRTGT